MVSTAQKRCGSRHIWLPIVVLVAAAFWWWWRARYAEYYTVIHYAVLVAGGLLILFWFLIFGAGSRKIRSAIVGGVLLALALFLTVFRPVYNGDMGVYRWRLRFAADADTSLKQLGSKNEASDWQTTSRDYPRFLGNGYWAEVKGV